MSSNEWDGAGKPPVGHATCEYFGAHQLNLWTTVNILATFGDTIFIDYGADWTTETDLSRFRPNRTPEQIAAEVRSDRVEELIKSLQRGSSYSTNELAEYLDAIGYRLQGVE